VVVTDRATFTRLIVQSDVVFKLFFYRIMLRFVFVENAFEWFQLLFGLVHIVLGLFDDFDSFPKFRLCSFDEKDHGIGGEDREC
jgi:hypothetical protein